MEEKRYPKVEYPKVEYPWDEWMDGKVHRVSWGKDFLVKPGSFQNYLRREAEKRKKVIWVRVHSTRTGKDVEWQVNDR